MGDGIRVDSATEPFWGVAAGGEGPKASEGLTGPHSRVPTRGPEPPRSRRREPPVRPSPTKLTQRPDRTGSRAARTHAQQRERSERCEHGEHGAKPLPLNRGEAEALPRRGDGRTGGRFILWRWK